MNWAYYTVPQSNADNREVEWPRGKGLGGMHPWNQRMSGFNQK